jgi:ribonuclease P protein component
MLPKKERLSRAEFNRFFSLGKRFHSKNFTIVYTPHNSLHVSVVTSKKVSPHAVDRNKVRRRIYDIVRHYRSEYGTCGVFIFLTKAGVTKCPYSDLKEEVVTCLQTIVKGR